VNYVDVCVIVLVKCVLGLVLSPEEGSSMLLTCSVLCSFDNSSMFYTCWFDVKLPEDDLKKIETRRIINPLASEFSFKF